jgi:serine/threonine-protein kinase
MSDEERAERPGTPSGLGGSAPASDAPAWTPPGKQLSEAVLDEVGLPQVIRRGNGMPSAASKAPAAPATAPRPTSEAPPLGSQPRARRISLPPVDERALEPRPEASETRPIADAPAPDTGLRRRPGEVAPRVPGVPSVEKPRSPRFTPLADAQDVARRRRGVDLPVLGVFGPYEILGRLAMGGMAEILLARRPGSEPLVIKKILAQYARDEDFVEMFLDEARIGSALDHPNIGRFLDFGEIDRQLFIAMEWVHGVTLGRLIRRARDKGGLPFPLACEIVARVADALHYAHTARDAEGNVMGLIHRDVSPHNVMIDFDGTVKLLDFGIAKAETQGHHTQAGVVKGKFAYMAPEQCRGRALDFRIDIFALGVVLFESLTGRSLYRRETEAATMHAIVAEPVPSLLEKIPNAPRELEAILRTALQKDPAARFPTAAAMRDVLQQYVQRTSEDVGPARVAGLVQQLFRDELEAPLVDSTPFGASYDLGTGRGSADDLRSDEMPSSSGQSDLRSTLAPPGTGARRARGDEPAPLPARAASAAPRIASSPASSSAAPRIASSVSSPASSSPASSSPASSSPASSSAAPSSVATPSSPPESRLSMDDLFGDGVMDDVPPVAPASPPPASPSSPAPPASPPATSGEDPLGLFADLPVPEIDVEIPDPTRVPEAAPRPTRTSEPTRAPARAERRVAATPDRPERRSSAQPLARPSDARPSDARLSETGRRSVTPTPAPVAPATLEAAPSHRFWKVLAAVLLVAVVALGGLALAVATAPATTSLTIATEPPGAPVRLNGGVAVRSPATFTDVTPGPQRVVVDGTNGPRWEGSIEVEPGTARTLRIVLE